MDHLLYNLSAAIGKKQEILNKVHDRDGGYFDTAVDQHKEKTRLVGFTASPNVYSFTEVKFNHGRFDKDVAGVDSQINQCKQAIDVALEKLKQETNRITSQNEAKANILGSEVSSFQRQLYAKQALYSDLQRCKAQEESKKQQQTLQLQETNTKIAACNDRLSQLGVQIIRTQDSINDSHAKIEKLSDELQRKQEANKVKLDKKEQEKTELYSSMTDLQRSAILLLLWQQKGQDEKKIIDEIKCLGLDMNYVTPSGDTLIGYAIKNNDLELFDLIMASGVDFNLEHPTINGTTLLQYTIASNQLELTSKILTKIGECGVLPSRTLLKAMQNNDEVSINLIFNHFAESSHAMYQGYSLLQLAILSDKKTMVEKIISFDASTLNDSNYKGETAFKLALKKGNKDIIHNILKELDLNTEVLQLIKDRDTDLLVTLFESTKGLIDQIDAKILYHLLEEQNIDVARALLENGIDVSETVQEAILQHNPVIIKSLLELDQEALQGAKIDKEVLSANLKNLGLEVEANNLLSALSQELLSNQHDVVSVGESQNGIFNILLGEE